VLDRESRRGAAVADVELVKDRAQVRMHRAAAEKERFGDLGVGHPPGHEAQDLDLPRRQVLEAGRRRGVCFRYLRVRGPTDSTGNAHVPAPCASDPWSSKGIKFPFL